ncbi:MAG: sulfur carrier protein ThiS [Duncaniella sp.]|nr:sulfur carrier protein ThiS [Duncaniella sp.]MDE6765261.1 sulfur carrier protein ThiS [Duncaniella sp.]
MNVTINDVSIVIPDGSTLADALATKEIKSGGIATAVNGTVIAASSRATHNLAEGDKIVIIKAFYGG